MLADGPLPSASATLMRVSLRLAERLDDQALMERALAVLRKDYALLGSTPFAYASHINLLACGQKTGGRDEAESSGRPAHQAPGQDMQMQMEN